MGAYSLEGFPGSEAGCPNATERPGSLLADFVNFEPKNTKSCAFFA
jgi:hypothetical protein